MQRNKENPFSNTTPEYLSADEVFDLFVDVFTDFPNMEREGHLFINGPRGSGKSMILRYMQPDVQLKKYNVEKINKLHYYSVYVPIKNIQLDLTELDRINNKHVSSALNELLLCLYILQYFIKQLNDVQTTVSKKDLHEFCGFLSKKFKRSDLVFEKNKITTVDFLKNLEDFIDGQFSDFLNYLKNLAFNENIPPFTNPLFGYRDTILPIFNKFKNLASLPNGPIYLMLDDADQLSLVQTSILNSWVAMRSTDTISIKISTQFEYKTFYTNRGNKIDSPHDFSEIDITTIYTTTKKGKFKERVQKIVERRLKLYNIDSSPNEYFPKNEVQEASIKKIATKYRKDWKEMGRGHSPSDDAVRYSRPDYFKSLAGKSKSSYNYSYSGFDQLVHISSGIIRNFLEPASIMYGECKSNNSDEAPITHIPHSVQNMVIRKYSEQSFLEYFEKKRRDQKISADGKAKYEKLYNLLITLGATFRTILLSKRSERRVFSIAFSSEPPTDLFEIIELGGKLGFLHISSIGNKDGTGRTRLYILTRLLAPYFNLDPTSFAGYLFVTPESMERAMHDPKAIIAKIRKEEIEDFFEQRQLNFFRN